MVSHPAELVKTRLQLQGELVKTGKAKVVYAGPFDAIRLVAKHEGLLGFYRGIVPGVGYQIVMNGIRFVLLSQP